MSKNTALEKIESHEKLCRIMQKQTHEKINKLETQIQTHEKINKLETQIDRIERILIGCAAALLMGMGGMITALVFKL
jgi:hypothetical protein